MAWSGTKCDTMFRGQLTFVTLLFAYGTIRIISWHGVIVKILPSPIPTPISLLNVIPLCMTTIAVPNNWFDPGNDAKFSEIFVAVFYFSLIQVTTPTSYPNCLFINNLCAHAAFERSTDRE